MNDENKVTYFGETDFRNKRTKFGIKRKDRTKHMYIIGKTGMGKSTLLENLAIQDIQNGEGIAFIDPHGSTAEKLLEHVPESRIKDVIYFAPFDLENPISFNVLEGIDEERKHLIAAGLMNAFKKIWQDAFSGRMEYILSMTLLALLDNPPETLLGVNRMYSDKDYRKKIVDNIKDPSVRSFWADEYAKYSEKFAQEATASIQNKVGQFTANPLIRNLLGQQESSFDFRQVMDQKKILIVNLSKGKMGPDNMRLIGGMVVTKIYLAAMSRADASAGELKKLAPFYLYVDEFQNFANESFAEILSESRKYNLSLTVANQYIDQMTEEVRGAILGNVGSLITFRIGATDAEIIEKEFAPYFTAEDLVNLGLRQIYLKLMIDGIGSQPFSCTTMDQIPEQEVNFVREIIANNRAVYSKPRSVVEEAIKQWFAPVVKEQSKKDYTADTSTNTTERTVPKRYNEERRAPQTERRNDRDNSHQARSNKGESGESVHSQAGNTPQRRKEDRVEVQPQDPKELLNRIRNGEVLEVVTPKKDIFPKREMFEELPLSAIRKDKSPAHSDSKVSLKEAIENALKEAPQSKASVEEVKREVPVEEEKIEDSQPRKKEIPEDVLKSLLE